MALLRDTSLLSRLIATLALLSSAESLMLVLWSNQLSQPDSILPTRNLTLVGSIHIGEDRLILIGIALVLALVLWALYSRSLFGLATSAVSENRRVAAIAGWAPSHIELVNFLIAGFLSALAAILLAPIVTLNAAILSVTVLSALAAALVGRFSSFGATVAAALVIGVLQSELSLFQPDIANAWHFSVPSLTGLPQAVPLLIILVVAVASGRARPARGETTARLPLPGSGRVARVPLALAVVIGAVLVFSAPSYSDALMTTFGIGIIIASVVVVSGYAGQLSLCQYALAGFGAWAAARAASSLDVPFLVALLIGVVAATAVGVLVALPAIRTRGVTLAIVTLALSLVFSALIFDNPSMTGGFEGIVVKSPEILGYQIDPTFHPQRYAALDARRPRPRWPDGGQPAPGRDGPQDDRRSLQRTSGRRTRDQRRRHQGLRVRRRRRHRRSRWGAHRVPTSERAIHLLRRLRFDPPGAIRRDRRTRVGVRGGGRGHRRSGGVGLGRS